MTPRTGLVLAALLLLPFAAPAQEPAAESAERVDQAMAGVLRAEDRRQVDDALRAALKDAAPEVRARAQVSLARIAAPGTRALMEAGLKDAVADVRVEAAFALGHLREAEAVPALAAAASDASPAVRASVAEALGRIHTKEAAPSILALLKDGEGRVRAEAALAAWQLPEAGPVTAPLLAAADSSDGATRFAAAYALARMGSAATAPASSGTAPAKPSATDARRIRDKLMTLATASEPEVRMQAARGLHTPGTPLEVSTLALLLRDADPRVRVNAVRSLSFHGAPTEPLISRALNDTDPRVIYATTEGLGKIGGTAAAKLLATGLDKAKNPWLLEAAIGSLAQAAPDLVPQAVLKLALNTSPLVRAACARALIGRSEPEAMSIATAYLKDASPIVVVGAVAAVAPSLAKLSEGLKDPLASTDPVVRAAVADAAADWLSLAKASPEARDDAFLVLDRVWERSRGDVLPDARLSVIEAAGKAGKDPRGKAILLRGLEDPERGVRIRAIDRLRTVWGEDASAKAGPASDLAVEEYRKILAWARSPKSAIVTVVREGYDPGRFTLRLDAKAAPLASWNFSRLAEKGFYDGNIVHRVVPNFVVQDGDPRGDGYGGPGYAIRDEYAHLRFGAGTLGMASDGKDTAGSQWFVTLSAQPHLDGRYTAFGQVVQNLAGVVGQLLPGDKIVSIRVYDGDGTEPLPPL